MRLGGEGSRRRCWRRARRPRDRSGAIAPPRASGCRSTRSSPARRSWSSRCEGYRRGPADRLRGPERTAGSGREPARLACSEDEALHGLDAEDVRHEVATGSTNSSASKRSSTPPCAGRIEPMSLMPRSRLINDSHRSPAGRTARRSRQKTKALAALSPSGATPGRNFRMMNGTNSAAKNAADQALLGLVRADLADSGVRPKYLPTKNPPTS